MEYAGSNIEFIGAVITKMLEIVVGNIFVVFAIGHNLRPAPSWHISVLIRSGIHSLCLRRESHLNLTYTDLDTSINNYRLCCVMEYTEI